MKESGLRVRGFEQGYSGSVAGIFAADWAVEFPHPLAPKVHVSVLSLPAIMLVCRTTVLLQEFCCMATVQD